MSDELSVVARLTRIEAQQAELLRRFDRVAAALPTIAALLSRDTLMQRERQATDALRAELATKLTVVSR